MYRVLWSTGNGTHKGPRFRYYEDALRYIDEHCDEASFAIQRSDGQITNIATRTLPTARGQSPSRRWNP